MSELNYCCFHGSPGTTKDFSLLNKEMESSNFYYEGNKDAPRIIGYSWGAVRALEYVLERKNVKEITLISPYIFTTPKRLLNLLLEIPFVGDFLLAKKSASSIQEFFQKSCYPNGIPLQLQEQASELSRPDLLKKSIKEKKTISKEFLNQVERHCRDIPVRVIFGNEDQTSLYEEQVMPLEKIFNNIKIYRIENAGHALVYTHYKDITKILEMEAK